VTRRIVGHFNTHGISRYYCGLCESRPHFAYPGDKASHLVARHGASVRLQPDGSYRYEAVLL
jgi:hypothetical protein